MTEQLLDVKRVLRLIWRHRKLGSIFLVVGLLASAALLFVKPAMYTASTLVLLPSSSSSSQGLGNNMSTDSQIATSASILDPVGKRIDSSLSLAALRQRVQAVGTATNVLEITAEGTTSAQAEDFANDVAKNLVNFVTTNGSATNASGLAALQSESTQLTKQIDDLEAEITSTNKKISDVGASSATGRADTALLASFTSDETQATVELDSLNSQIAQAQLGSSAANAGTEVIQKATTATVRSPLGSALYVVVGGLMGLAVGSVFIVAKFRGDRRLRRRDQIAEAVGLPVLLSLSVARRSKSTEWTEFLEQYRPSSNDRWRVRKALRDLGMGDGPSGTVVVLALEGDRDSLAVAPQLALCAAALGTTVSLIVIGKDQNAMDLRAAVNRLSTSGSHPNLKAGRSRSALTILAIAVNAINPELASRQGTTATVLAVSAGYATAEELARVAIAATEGQQPIGAIVVTNPDPDDLTSGRSVDSGPPSIVAYRRPVQNRTVVT